MQAKYIIVKTEGELELPIIFDKLFNHVDFIGVAEMKGKPIAAGEVSITVLPRSQSAIDSPFIQCYGRSVSLKLKSRGVLDSNAINKAFYRR